MLILTAAIVGISIGTFLKFFHLFAGGLILLIVAGIIVAIIVTRNKRQKQVPSSSLSLVESPELEMISNIEIKEKLGSGNYGSVYRGLWNGKTAVAVKTLHGAQASKEQSLSEAKLLQSLKHPNIVQFFGLFIQEGQYYLVMEYLENGNLLALLHLNPDLVTLDQLCSMTCDTLQGMTFLESKNVIHCDLAARNLLLRKQDNGWIVKVSDFGMGQNSPTSVFYSKDAQMPIKVCLFCLWLIIAISGWPPKLLNFSDIRRKATCGRLESLFGRFLALEKFLILD
jgi:serine/threonine protein kinase